ncbi:MAG: tetratricopeptide repeat protein [Myxococcota bacterium]
MTEQKPPKEDRIERVRGIVAEDFARISSGDDPFTILNLSREATLEEAKDCYERYEKFYRAENFQRLGDMDLTRKALHIRRAIGRAMVTIQGELVNAPAAANADPSESQPVIPEVDADCAALSDIYFRDGLTYLKLRDLNSAVDCLQRAVDYDPGRGDVLAYYAYARFKMRHNDPSVTAKSREQLDRAARMNPHNIDIFLLRTRFGINTEDSDFASQALAAVKRIRPDHPKIGKLERRLARLDQQS